MCTYTYVYICPPPFAPWQYTYIHMCLYACSIYISYIYFYMYIKYGRHHSPDGNTHIYICTYIFNIHILCVHMYMYICICIGIYTCICICTRVNIHMYTAATFCTMAPRTTVEDVDRSFAAFSMLRTPPITFRPGVAASRSRMRLNI